MTMTIYDLRNERDQLREQRKLLRDSAESILDRAEAYGTDLSAEQAKLFEDSLAEVRGIDGKLDALEKQIDKEADRRGSMLAAASLQSSINQPQAGVRGSITTVGAMSTPNIRHICPELKAFKNTPEGQRDAWLTGNFIKALVTGDQRAKEICSQAGYDINMAGGIGSPSEGGYLVPSPMSNGIIEVRAQVGVGRRACRIVTMTADTWTEPKLLSGPTVKYVGENSEIDESDETWGAISLTAKKRAILTRISNELNDDALISVADHLVSRFGYEFAAKEDAEFINGDGASTYGGEVGLLSALGSAGVVDAATGHDTWGELDMADFTTAMSKLPSKYSQNAIWICSMNFYVGAMLRALAAAGGNTMLSLAQGVNEGLFLGKRVLFTDEMPTSSSASTIGALYGSFADAAVLGSRKAVEVRISDQRYFEFDQIGVRGIVRSDLNVHESGDGSNVGAYVALKTAS